MEVFYKIGCSQAWWLTPVISVLWEAKAGGSPRSGVRDHPGQHGKTPVSTKNTKISWAWWRVLVIPGTCEAEAGELLDLGGGGCSELRSCHCSPDWALEQDSLKKMRTEPPQKKWMSNLIRYRGG